MPGLAFMVEPLLNICGCGLDLGLVAISSNTSSSILDVTLAFLVLLAFLSLSASDAFVTVAGTPWLGFRVRPVLPPPRPSWPRPGSLFLDPPPGIVSFGNIPFLIKGNFINTRSVVMMCLLFCLRKMYVDSGTDQFVFRIS